MDVARDVLVLDVLDGAAKGSRLALRAGSSVVLGRSADADLVLPDEGVSRQHALITVAADGVVVRDLGSTNGTTVGGRPVIGSRPLVAGDDLQLAGVRLRCRTGPAPEVGPSPDTTAPKRPAPEAEDTSEWGTGSPVRKATAVWRRVVPAVLTAGGLAGAVTAVLALWPDPDPQDSGVITSAVVVVGQPLSSFVPVPRIEPRAQAASSVLSAPVAVELVSVGDPDLGSDLAPDLLDEASPAVSPPDSEATASASPSTEATPTQQSDPTGGPTDGPSAVPSSTTAPDPGGVGPAEELRILDLRGSSIFELSPQEQQDRVDDILDEDALDGLVPVSVPRAAQPVPSAAAVLAVSPVIALGDNGERLPADQAARRLAARLEQVRSRSVGDKRDPLGAETDVSVELEGLRDTQLLLFWRLLSVGGQPLPPDWSTPTVAYRLTPGTERDVATLPMWIPMPRPPGPYRLRLVLVHEDGERILSTHLTEPFS